MVDLRNAKLLYLKGGLFVLLGIGAATLLLVDSPSFRTAFLLAVCVWAFARAYYFAFYVIQHYVDESYRFAGLVDFVRYVLRGRKSE